MAAYASGKNANGFCDRCGQRFRLEELNYEVVNKVRTGFRVCEVCFDQDHPQLRVGEIKTDDPQSLRDPRPDTALSDSRTLSGSVDLSTYAKY